MLLGEPSNDGKVDICNTIARQHQNAGGTQVRMEVSIPIDLVERAPIDAFGDQTQILFLISEFLDVFQVALMDCIQDLQHGCPANELPGQNTLGGVFASKRGIDFESIAS